MAAGKGSRALVFDAYGTLFDVHSVASLAEELFPGHGDALSRLWRQKQLEYTWLRTLMRRYEDFERVTEAALRHATRALGLDCPPGPLNRLLVAYLHLAPYPDVRDALPALGTMPLAILSNGSPHMLGAVVKNAGLDAAFAHVISVDEVKLFKPSPKVYQLACDRLGLKKAEIGFVSSNYWDVCGAASFGFRAWWINRGGATPDELGQQPVATLASLAELAAQAGKT